MYQGDGLRMSSPTANNAGINVRLSERTRDASLHRKANKREKELNHEVTRNDTNLRQSSCCFVCFRGSLSLSFSPQTEEEMHNV